MSITVMPRHDGKLVISCGDESLVYPSHDSVAILPGGAAPPIIKFRPISPDGGGVTCLLGPGRRSNRERLALAASLDQFDNLLATAPLHRTLRIGWRPFEPLQIAELRSVLENRERIPSNVEIWPMTDTLK